MNGHHLILGELTDFLTGETLQDTHDERYRQSIARMLVEQKGYAKELIRPRSELRVTAGDKCAVVRVDFSVTVENRIAMIVRYAPGSLVTRHRPALAASRTLTSYQIPVVVVTNGIQADIIDGYTGKVISHGLDMIPTAQEILMDFGQGDVVEISKERAEKEHRIIYAYDVDGSCPCDDTICRISG